MIIFIDESGDAGFKISKGSTPVFVIALVIFDDELDAEDTALKIKRHRQSINKGVNYEFKFNKSNKEKTLQFLKVVKDCKFRIRAIVFKKENIYSKNLKSNKANFYNYAVKSVLQNNSDSIKNASIRIDGLGEKKFKQSLASYLRKALNSPDKQILKDFKFRDSKKDVLIQLADMVAGSLKRAYDKDKTDSSIYKAVLKDRIEDVWEFE